MASNQLQVLQVGQRSYRLVCESISIVTKEQPSVQQIDDFNLFDYLDSMDLELHNSVEISEAKGPDAKDINDIYGHTSNEYI